MIEAELFEKAILKDAYSYYIADLTENKLIPPIVELVDGETLDYTSKFGHELPSYDKIVSISADKYVEESYRENYKKDLSSSELIKQFEAGTTITEYICKIHSSKIGWHYRKYVSYLSEEENGHIMLLNVAYNATQAVNEVLKKQKQKEEKQEMLSILSAFSSSYDGIYYVDIRDDSYKVVSINGNFDKLDVDYNHSDFFEDSYINSEKVVFPEDLNIVKEYLNKEKLVKNTENGIASSATYRLLIGDEPIYYRMRTSKSEKDKNHLILVTENVDKEVKKQNKFFEESRAAIEEALLRVQFANEAKSTFLFNMSHDIRTPMNAIKGYTAMAKKHIKSKNSVVNYLDKIDVAGENLLSLVNQILEMSRIEAGKVVLEEKTADIYEQISALVTIAEVNANARGIVLHTNMSSIKDKYVCVDVTRMNQIISNILGNAIKYTNEGGRVEFIVEQLDCEKDDFAKYKLVVKDNGIGMSPAFLTKVFDQFAREHTSTESGVQGTGLGLAIVKNLVDLMGGTIDIDSKKGVGTTVTITMQMKKSEKKNEEKEDELDGVVTLLGKNVLLVEDNEMNREIAKDILEDNGIFVYEAKDGNEAVRMLATKKENIFDAVLMDVQMPNLNGYEATRIIRKLQNGRYKDLPIIAMTANAFEEDKKNAIEAGMNEHLSKPVEINKLLGVLVRFIK